MLCFGEFQKVLIQCNDCYIKYINSFIEEFIMQLSTKITVNKSIDDVWNILTAEFLSLDKWMAAIETTVEKKQGSMVKNAPVIGRVATIGAAAAKGASLDETITYISEQDYILDIDTDLIDVPGVSPMKGYMTRIQLTSTGENS